MNKYRWLLALVVLVLASLACQTVMGGGPQVPDVPQVPNNYNDNSGDSGPEPTVVPPSNDGGGSDNGGGQSSNGFPMPADATNVVEAQDTLVFETGLSVDEVVAFYRDAYGKQGLKERTSMTVTMGQLFTIVFDGNPSGKAISISGADTGSGTTAVTIVRQDF